MITIPGVGSSDGGSVAVEDWQGTNDRLVAEAVATLRACLSRAARRVEAARDEVARDEVARDQTGTAQAVPQPPPRSRRRWWWPPAFGRSRSGDTAVAGPADRGSVAAACAVTTSPTGVPVASAPLPAPPALAAIARAFGLSVFERDVLLLCAAVEIDTRLPALCAAASGQPAVTFALAMSLLDAPSWDVLSPARPLLYWGLVEPDRSAGCGLVVSPLRADQRIVNAIRGLDHLDERLLPVVEVVTPVAVPLPASQDAVAAAAVESLSRAGSPAADVSRPLPVVADGRPGHESSAPIQLVGRDADTRELVASRIADGLGRVLYRMKGDAVPTSATERDAIARVWRRETVLSPVALYIDVSDEERPDAAGAMAPAGDAVAALARRAGGVVVIGSRDAVPGLPAAAATLEIPRPTRREQREAWTRALGLDARVDPPTVDVGTLVEQFDLETSAIGDIVVTTTVSTTVSTVSGPADTAAGGDLTARLWDACRARTRPRMENLAQRVAAVATWDRLVLPEAQTALLRQVAAQVGRRSVVYGDWGFGDRMNRGLGISALFSGESGTGKSMAAEVLANELRLDLYRIDLSSVVSKYIGETEKNLRRLFDAAETGGALLFFDEADALFGKRSEVRDAHDRYANIEVNYLLQRMEAYAGLAVLATNMKSAIDQAFMRRLRFVVTFPFPGRLERTRMWERAFPDSTPVGPLDVDRLAGLSLTGAGIANVAINAAFLAAAAGRPVGMRDVLDATRDELRKLDLPFAEADLRLEVPA